MSRYLPTHLFKTSFDGDEVTMRLRPLTLEDALRLQNVADAAERAKIVASYVEDLTGLKDGNGNAVTVETVFGVVYFLGLVEAIVNELLRVSVVQNPEKSDK